MRVPAWPSSTDSAAYRRYLAARAVAIVLIAAPIGGALVYLYPEQVAWLTALAAGLVMGAMIAADVRAREFARAAEVARAFQQLAVVHAGRAVRVPQNPVVGEFATHGDAYRAALRLGTWALIVRAYDRFYVLRARSIENVGDQPISFRQPAVADLVPQLSFAEGA